MELDFVALFEQATVIAKTVLIILLVMSVISWAVIFQKWFSLSGALSRITEGTAAFDKAANMAEAVQIIGAKPSSPLYNITNLGVMEYNRAIKMGNYTSIVASNIQRTLDRGVNETVDRLGSSLSLLATAANTAPFIGLFGTVWGIIHSFHAIGALKSVSLSTVAPGISEALIATALGLLVAVPATIGYNIFQGKLNRVETALRSFSGVFINRVQREINATRSEKA